MKTISIHDAKTNLSKYIEAVKQGETIYIGGYGKREVMLTAIPANDRVSERPLGIAKGAFYVAKDAFDQVTDQEIADLMTGDDI